MAPIFDSIENLHLWPLGLLCLVPLLLYLLDRQRARHVDWPAVRFFLVRRSSRLRWIKLREALLILIRTLAIAVIVLAFLRPVQTVHVETTDEDDAVRRGVVLVIDSSVSMSYRHGEPEGADRQEAGVGVGAAGDHERTGQRPGAHRGVEGGLVLEQSPRLLG